MRVLIVGAGPTGLTAAVELARQGVLPAVVDSRPGASLLSRAVGITPHSLSHLTPSGVAERLIAAGIALRNARVYRGDRLVATLPIHSPRTDFPHLLGLPQDTTESILAHRLAELGGSVSYGVSVERVEGRADGATVGFDDGSHRDFDIVIGADGVHSTVRRDAGFDFPGFDLDEPWSIADVDVENWRHPDDFTLFRVRPGAVVIVAPIGADRLRLVATTSDALATLPVALAVKRVRRTATFDLAVRQTSTYSRGAVHLAGDAAHCHSPVGGRGMNLGIADAAWLAQCIAHDSLEDYSPRRHRAGRTAMAMTERGRRLITSRHPAAAIVFATALATLNLVPGLRRRVGRFFVEF